MHNLLLDFVMTKRIYDQGQLFPGIASVIAYTGVNLEDNRCILRWIWSDDSYRSELQTYFRSCQCYLCYNGVVPVDSLMIANLMRLSVYEQKQSGKLNHPDCIIIMTNSIQSYVHDASFLQNILVILKHPLQNY